MINCSRLGTNAVTGTLRDGYSSVIGPFGSGTANDNTHRLLSFCAANNLRAEGSWFQRRNIYRWSWISNDGQTRKELDHIITRKLGTVRSYRVYRGAEAPANTDHRLVVADVAVDFRPTQKQQPALKLDAQQLHDNKELGARYNLEIKKSFRSTWKLT